MHLPRRAAAACLLLGLLPASRAGGQPAPDAAVLVASGTTASPQRKDQRMWMTVGSRRFAVTLADTPAARELVARLPLTLDMEDLHANEKHVKLPQALPSDASRPGTIRSGDVMLWGTDTLVIFYVTFSSQYSYTRLGRIEEAGELAQALGPRGVRVVFSRN